MTISHSTATSTANGVVSFSVTTPSDTEFTTVMIALFCVASGLGLVAIGDVALNVLLVFKTVKVKANANEKDDLFSKQSLPVAHASPLGTALIANPNTVELAFGLRGESTSMWSKITRALQAPQTWSMSRAQKLSTNSSMINYEYK